jgi:hypothetical protein
MLFLSASTENRRTSPKIAIPTWSTRSRAATTTPIV